MHNNQGVGFPQPMPMSTSKPLYHYVHNLKNTELQCEIEDDEFKELLAIEQAKLAKEQAEDQARRAEEQARRAEEEARWAAEQERLRLLHEEEARRQHIERDRRERDRLLQIELDRLNMLRNAVPIATCQLEPHFAYVKRKIEHND